MEARDEETPAVPVKKKPFYRRHIRFDRRTFTERLIKRWWIAVKCAIMLVVPMFVSVPTQWAWYHYEFLPGQRWSHEMNDPLMAAVLVLAILGYIMLATMLGFDFTLKKYSRMRTNAMLKREHAFKIDQKDGISPLTHTLIGVFAFIILRTVWLIHYSDPAGGCYVVGTTAYLLTIMFLVVQQIDHPCSGLWFIDDIPFPWLRESWDDYLVRHQKEVQDGKISCAVCKGILEAG